MSLIEDLEGAIREQWTEEGVEIESPSSSTKKIRCRLPGKVQDVHELILLASNFGATVDVETTSINGHANVVLWMYVDERQPSSAVKQVAHDEPTASRMVDQCAHTTLLFSYALSFVIVASHAINFVFPTLYASSVEFIHNVTAPV